MAIDDLCRPILVCYETEKKSENLRRFCAQMNEFDWGDVRVVHAVAEAGSLSGAARALGVNHATVLRRVAAFERATGVTVFDRTARGYRVAPRRGRIVAAMQAMDEAALGVARALDAARAPLAGTVRVTSTDTLCLTVLAPIVARLMSAAEGLTIELNAQNQPADLGRLDADVAVRPAVTLAPGLVGARAGRLAFAVYAAPEAARGWLGFGGSLQRSAPSAWLDDHVADAEIAGRADSFPVLREMAAAGQGQAILPCLLGDADARLVRRAGLLPEMYVDVWVASHADLAEVPRIKAVRAMLLRALADAPEMAPVPGGNS